MFLNANNDYGEMTLEQISILKGILNDLKVDSRIPLSVWYDKIQLLKIRDLSNGDIAKLIRQEIFLSHVVPEAINRTLINPLSGSLGDGEILESFSYVGVDMWENEGEKFCNELKSYLQKVLLNLKDHTLNIPYDNQRFDDHDREDLGENLMKTISILDNAINKV